MPPKTFNSGATAAAVPREGSAAPGSPAAAPAIPDPAATLARLAALPALAPHVPLAGHATRVAPLPGSSDALALAQLARECAAGKRVLAVIAADAQGAQRIAEELPWFAPGVRVALLPDWETLPYDPFSPHHDLVSERLATLYRVSRGECDVLVVAATTALHRLAPPSYLAAFTFFLKQRTTLDVDALRAQLALAGYHHVTQVVSPGEFSIRGGLIDLFPMGSPLPYRLDLFGDDIESIKTFDVDTQRTLYPVPDIRLLPAREFPLDEAGRTRFRSRYREVFEGDPSKSPLYRDVSNGIAPGGHRILPAAVLRDDGDARRLPAARCGRRAGRRHRRRGGALLAGHRCALSPSARRQGPPAPAAGRRCSCRKMRSMQRSSLSRGSSGVRARARLRPQASPCRFPPSRSTAAPTTPWPRSSASSPTRAGRGS